MRISMHELRSDLSHYVARARAGEVIEVTSHGQLVVRIVGIPAADFSGVASLLESGAAEWAGGKPAFRPAVRLPITGKALSEMLLEDRR
jgi:prevent-host-death family protein